MANHKKRWSAPRNVTLRAMHRGMIRSLLKSWKLNFIAVFSLAIAMALSVIVLSFSNAILWRPPVAHNPERLVTLYTVAQRREGKFLVSGIPIYPRSQPGLLRSRRAQLRLLQVRCQLWQTLRTGDPGCRLRQLFRRDGDSAVSRQALCFW